jgi:hypothetical protein
MRKFFVSIVVALLWQRDSPAQSHSIIVGEDRLVNIGINLSLVEPHLSIDMANPKRLLGGAMVARADGSYGVIGISSSDGGETWMSHDFAVNGGDVWTTFLSDGTGVLSLLGGERSALQVFRSNDGGRTWSNPVTVATGEDHVTLLTRGSDLFTISAGYGIGHSGRRRSAVTVARSGDGGVTFGEPERIVASNLSYEAQNPAVLSDGTLLIPFADHHRPGSRRRLESQRDWLLVSKRGGHIFSEPLLISESCDGRGGWSSLAADPTRDRIDYVCAGRDFNGIQFRYSDDLGETWSEILRVDRPGEISVQTRTPAIAVNRDGVVAVAWYDARNDRSTIKGNFRCQEIFFTASVDGGVTFLPEVKVSRAPSCPATPRNVETALRFPAGGEYMGVVAALDGSFRLLWPDNRGGVYQLYTATVSVAASR